MGHFSSKSVLFNGTSQYVTMSNVLGFEYTQSFSWSFWLKTAPGYSGGGYQVCKQTIGSNQYRGWGSGIGSSGDMGVHLRNDNASNNRIEVRSTTATLNDGNWNHVALVWVGNAIPVAAGLSIYINGQLETPVVVQDNLSATILNTAPFNLGARNNGGDAHFGGSIDDALVFNTALTALQVSELYVTSEPRDPADLSYSGSISGEWYMGDGDTAPTIIDHSGNNYHGTMVNSPTLQTDAPEGLIYGDSPINDFGAMGPLGGLIGPPYTDRVFEYISFGYGGGGGGGIIKKYKMRARDDGAAPPGYVTWIADTPDFAGAGFSGASPTPVGSMVAGSATVVAEWEV